MSFFGNTAKRRLYDKSQRRVGEVLGLVNEHGDARKIFHLPLCKKFE
jgi:hypothetical protein